MAYTQLPVQPERVIDALHIPDGFVNTPVAIAGYAVTAVFIAIAVRKSNTSMSEKAVPLTGVLAAFVFAAQMINFPVAGGTSGHLLGGALVAILIGPWAAVIAMTAVIGVQALIFQDGGIAALGVNVFNMGILTAFAGYGLYKMIGRVLPDTPPMRLVTSFTAAWCTVVLAAIFTAVQLAISNTSPLDVALPAMVGVHVLIGIGEGLITAAAVALVQSSRPDLLESPTASTTAQGV